MDDDQSTMSMEALLKKVYAVHKDVVKGQQSIAHSRKLALKRAEVKIAELLKKNKELIEENQRLTALSAARSSTGSTCDHGDVLGQSLGTVITSYEKVVQDKNDIIRQLEAEVCRLQATVRDQTKSRASGAVGTLSLSAAQPDDTATAEEGQTGGPDSTSNFSPHVPSTSKASSGHTEDFEIISPDKGSNCETQKLRLNRKRSKRARYSEDTSPEQKRQKSCSSVKRACPAVDTGSRVLVADTCAPDLDSTILPELMTNEHLTGTKLKTLVETSPRKRVLNRGNKAGSDNIICIPETLAMDVGCTEIDCDNVGDIYEDDLYDETETDSVKRVREGDIVDNNQHMLSDIQEVSEERSRSGKVSQNNSTTESHKSAPTKVADGTDLTTGMKAVAQEDEFSLRSVLASFNFKAVKPADKRPGKNDGSSATKNVNKSKIVIESDSESESDCKSTSRVLARQSSDEVSDPEDLLSTQKGAKGASGKKKHVLNKKSEKSGLARNACTSIKEVNALFETPDGKVRSQLSGQSDDKSGDKAREQICYETVGRSNQASEGKASRKPLFRKTIKEGGLDGKVLRRSPRKHGESSSQSLTNSPRSSQESGQKTEKNTPRKSKKKLVADVDRNKSGTDDYNDPDITIAPEMLKSAKVTRSIRKEKASNKSDGESVKVAEVANGNPVQIDEGLSQVVNENDVTMAPEECSFEVEAEVHPPPGFTGLHDNQTSSAVDQLSNSTVDFYNVVPVLNGVLNESKTFQVTGGKKGQTTPVNSARTKSKSPLVVNKDKYLKSRPKSSPIGTGITRKNYYTVDVPPHEVTSLDESMTSPLLLHSGSRVTGAGNVKGNTEVITVSSPNTGSVSSPGGGSISDVESPLLKDVKKTTTENSGTKSSFMKINRENEKSSSSKRTGNKIPRRSMFKNLHQTTLTQAFLPSARKIDNKIYLLEDDDDNDDDDHDDDDYNDLQDSVQLSFETHDDQRMNETSVTSNNAKIPIKHTPDFKRPVMTNSAKKTKKYKTVVGRKINLTDTNDSDKNLLCQGQTGDSNDPNESLDFGDDNSQGLTEGQSSRSARRARGQRSSCKNSEIQTNNHNVYNRNSGDDENVILKEVDSRANTRSARNKHGPEVVDHGTSGCGVSSASLETGAGVTGARLGPNRSLDPVVELTELCREPNTLPSLDVGGFCAEDLAPGSQGFAPRTSTMMPEDTQDDIPCTSGSYRFPARRKHNRQENVENISPSAPDVHLLDNSFDRVPKRSEAGVAHVAVVKKQDHRQKLEGHGCKQCIGFYKAAGRSEAEIQTHMDGCSRHRAQYKPPDTPEKYWDIEFIESQDCPQTVEKPGEEAGPSYRRRRRLNKFFRSKHENSAIPDTDEHDSQEIV